MIYTMEIGGMKCAHCEERVRKELEKITGVFDVRVNREENRAVISADESVKPEQLTAAVTAADADGKYTVLDIGTVEEAAETAEPMIDCCCSGKHKDRSEKERKDLMNRLKRIEGQVRGVENMLEKDAYCTDVLVQVSAISAALNSFNKVLLANHVRTCVADNIRAGNDEAIDELVVLLQKLMK